MKSALAVFVVALLTLGLSLQAQSGVKDELEISLPGKNWALKLDARGFEVEEEEISPDGSARSLFAQNGRTRMVMSVFLEKAPKKGDSKAARAYYWNQAKKSPPRETAAKMRQVGKMAIVEYFIKEYEGEKINQKHLSAFLAKGDIWIDIHLSKVKFKPRDKRLFEAILKTAKINNNFRPTRVDLYNFGNAFFNAENYKEAVVYYQKALDLEKKEQKLDRVRWRVLVDNLGMAYGISGDLANAKAVLEYGASKDPTYPMFYYNLACAYAEENDLDNAILNLKTAFRYKDNANPGEEMPDPREDSSFARFLENDTFQKTLSSL